MGKLDDLERLHKLKESGALTEGEFEIEKKKILNNDVEIVEDVYIDNLEETITEEGKEDQAKIEKKINNKICSKCGNELFEEDSFCGKCGEYINDVKVNSNTNKKSEKVAIKKYIMIILIGTPVLAIALLVLSFWITNTSRIPINNSITSQSGNTETDSQNNNKLSLDNVQMEITFTDVNNINEETKKILAKAYSYVTDLYPNAKWIEAKITAKDGYGRYVVFMKFVKSSVSENVSGENIVVWVKDINTDNMGYCIYPGAGDYRNGWGTPLTD